MDAPTPIESSQAASDAKRARGSIAWTEISAPGRLLLSNEFGLIALIAIFGAIFALGTPGFGSQFNLFPLGRTTAIDIMIGFSMMVVIVTGGLNLSVGAIGVCAAMAMGWLLERVGLPVPLSIAGALALGGALGAVNGALIVRSGLHSFIIRAQAFRNLPPEISAFGKMRIEGYVSALLIVSVVVGLGLMVLYRQTPL